MINVIPKPKYINVKEGCIQLDYRHKIIVSGEVTDKLWTSLLSLQNVMKLYWGQALEIRKCVQVDIYSDAGMIFSCNSSMEIDEYKIETENGILKVTGGTELGLHYAIQTIKQLVKQYVLSMPCLEIQDQPLYANRGFYYDVSRGRMPKIKYLENLVDKMVELKMNQLQLYVEHTFPFEDMSEAWRETDTLSATDIQSLDRYCRERYIDLVPSLSTFGHMYHLLKSKEYGHLCELEQDSALPFSFCDRMNHHTIAVSDSTSLEVVKKMIKEYMGLFSSRYFNICADETFDLGKGKSSEERIKLGTPRLYMDYVKKLCTFVIEQGKIPMLWGDMLAGFPELVNELPEGTICLNWGYSAEQNDNTVASLADSGATQYVCPGACGWNLWFNLVDSSFENIRRMSAYGKKYGAIGLLNTDWGDFGHINHPEFSYVPMVYGAVFAWQHDEVNKTALDREISKLFYNDNTGQWIENIKDIASFILFQWEAIVKYCELSRLGNSQECWNQILPKIKYSDVVAVDEAIAQKRILLRENMIAIETSKRTLLPIIENVLEGIELWNRVALMDNISEHESPMLLARNLELWFADYSKIWKRDFENGDLDKIAQIVFYYTDQLRMQQ